MPPWLSNFASEDVRFSMASARVVARLSSASVRPLVRASMTWLSSIVRFSKAWLIEPARSSSVMLRRLALSSSALSRWLVRWSISDTKLSVRSPKAPLSELPAVSSALVRFPPDSTMVPAMRWLIMSKSKTRPVWLSVMASRTRSVLVITASRWLASSWISARMRDSLSE